MSKSNKLWLTTQDEVTDFLLYTAPDGQVAESNGAIPTTTVTGRSVIPRGVPESIRVIPTTNVTGCSVIPREVAESIGEVILC